MRGSAAAFVFAAALATSGSAFAGYLLSAPGEAIDLPTRPNVTMRYAAFAPDQPAKAIVVLMVGGQGFAGVPERTVMPGWSARGNFLARIRENLRRRGLYVAIPDTPSDRRDGFYEFRADQRHAEDIATLIAELRRRVPGRAVWLVGTSAGSISVAYVGAQLQGAGGPDGLILTSSVTRPSHARGGTLTTLSADLGKVRTPVLIMGHPGDSCDYSPFADAEAIKRGLSNAPKVDIRTVDGGDRPELTACEALSAHGFWGVEDRAAAAIADWISTAKN